MKTDPYQRLLICGRGGVYVVVFAFDDKQSLQELENALKGIMGDALVFKGFCDTEKLWHEAQQEHYDVAFVNVEINNRKGMLLFGKLKSKFPARGFIGMTKNERYCDSFTLLKYHANDCLVKPVDIKRLSESVSRLRVAAN